MICDDCELPILTAANRKELRGYKTCTCDPRKKC